MFLRFVFLSVFFGCWILMSCFSYFPCLFACDLSWYRTREQQQHNKRSNVECCWLLVVLINLFSLAHYGLACFLSRATASLLLVVAAASLDSLTPKKQNNNTHPKKKRKKREQKKQKIHTRLIREDEEERIGHTHNFFFFFRGLLQKIEIDFFSREWSTKFKAYSTCRYEH